MRILEHQVRIPSWHLLPGLNCLLCTECGASLQEQWQRRTPCGLSGQKYDTLLLLMVLASTVVLISESRSIDGQQINATKGNNCCLLWHHVKRICTVWANEFVMLREAVHMITTVILKRYSEQDRLFTWRLSGGHRTPGCIMLARNVMASSLRNAVWISGEFHRCESKLV